MTLHDVRHQVQKQFGDVAANYRHSQVHAAGRDLDLMVESAKQIPNPLVLDAGCGAGHTALAFAPIAKSVIAYDFTRSMLEQVETLTRERSVENVSTQHGDVDNLPFCSGTFDIVATRYSAHHWLHPQQAVTEFRRVLRAGGVLLISDIMAREDYAQDTFLQTIELLRDPSHVRDFRISEWRQMLTQAGFASDVILTFDLTLHFETWTRRMATPTQNSTMIKSLFTGASDDIRRGFGLPEQLSGDDFNFVIPGAVICASVAEQ